MTAMPKIEPQAKKKRDNEKAQDSTDDSTGPVGEFLTFLVSQCGATCTGAIIWPVCVDILRIFLAKYCG